MAGEADLYVYALSEPGLPQTLRLRGHSLRALTAGAIVAIVEPAKAPRPTVEAVQEQHDIVRELAARSTALLPARFGSRLPERALRSLIDRHRSTIAEALGKVRGRAQMTVRIFGEPDAPSKHAAQAKSGTEFLEERRTRAHYLPPELAVVRQALGQIAAAERIEPGTGALRVTVFHLVANDSIEAYRERASSLQSLLAPHRVTVSGPWPAFAFTPELF